MKIKEIINRIQPPVPWEEGDNIPWNDPAFSARMLKEHLSQQHNAASRRFEIIDQQIEWIFDTILKNQPKKVLDLGCGPGFYTQRLAHLGCNCTGIDYSPASIEYGIKQADTENLTCSYMLHDIREADYGEQYDLAMLLYGEFNVFKKADISRILRKIHQALKPGGSLLLEPHHHEALMEMGKSPDTWFSSQSGLFSETPHLVLEENRWKEESQTATVRYYVIDAQSNNVELVSASYQAYSEEEYAQIIEAAGFYQVQFHPGLCKNEEDKIAGLMAISAIKK
jgi:ubiquinone/menaquinone biosynthesis C-methylase UbiE